MTSAMTIFISGITGVFCGMGLLYVSIRITGAISDRVRLSAPSSSDLKGTR